MWERGQVSQSYRRQLAADILVDCYIAANIRVSRGRNIPPQSLIAATCMDRLEVAVDSPKGFQNTRLKVRWKCSPIAIEQDIAGCGMIKSGFVGPRAPQCIILVHQHHDPSSQGDALSAQSLGIAAAIPAFMMRERNL